MQNHAAKTKRNKKDGASGGDAKTKESKNKPGRCWSAPLLAAPPRHISATHHPTPTTPRAQKLDLQTVPEMVRLMGGPKRSAVVVLLMNGKLCFGASLKKKGADKNLFFYDFLLLRTQNALVRSAARKRVKQP